MILRVRPLDQWPGTPRLGRPAQFSAGWSDTVALLERELKQRGATHGSILLAVSDADIRIDGLIRSNARPLHPGVIVAFDSKHGPLKYVYDEFALWQDNVRAIALGLEALRTVDRYGISRRGEQYTGYRALPGGSSMTLRDALDNLATALRRRPLTLGEVGPSDFRAARKATHPDSGGDSQSFDLIQRSIARIEEETTTKGIELE